LGQILLLRHSRCLGVAALLLLGSLTLLIHLLLGQLLLSGLVGIVLLELLHQDELLLFGEVLLLGLGERRHLIV